MSICPNFVKAVKIFVEWILLVVKGGPSSTKRMVIIIPFGIFHTEDRKTQSRHVEMAPNV
jgi:hypothetical protein